GPVHLHYYPTRRSSDLQLDRPLSIFALVPIEVVKVFAVWQLVTYLFLHGGFGHIIWNMLALWMFGADLERTWGTRRFLKFYFFRSEEHTSEFQSPCNLV